MILIGELGNFKFSKSLNSSILFLILLITHWIKVLIHESCIKYFYVPERFHINIQYHFLGYNITSVNSQHSHKLKMLNKAE